MPSTFAQYPVLRISGGFLFHTRLRYSDARSIGTLGFRQHPDLSHLEVVQSLRNLEFVDTHLILASGSREARVFSDLHWVIAHDRVCTGERL